jgi:hypothetical protein
MLPVDYVAFVTAFFTSTIANYLVRDFLYDYSAHNVVWLLVFLMINLYLIVFLQARNYFYSEKTKQSLWWKSRQEFVQFLYSLVLFVVIQFFFETTVYLLAISDAQFNDYLNFANFGVFFIFVFIRKVQSVISAGERRNQKKEERGERDTRMKTS